MIGGADRNLKKYLFKIEEPYSMICELFITEIKITDRVIVEVIII